MHRAKKAQEVGEILLLQILLHYATRYLSIRSRLTVLLPYLQKRSFSFLNAKYLGMSGSVDKCFSRSASSTATEVSWESNNTFDLHIHH